MPLTGSNVADRAGGNAVLSCDHVLPKATLDQLPNRKYVSVLQFRSTDALASLLTILPNLVADVFEVRPQKQMVGTATRRVVAPVADSHTRRDGSEAQVVRIPVSTAEEAVRGADFDNPISRSIIGARPNPAAIALFHTWPKRQVLLQSRVMPVDEPSRAAVSRSFHDRTAAATAMRLGWNASRGIALFRTVAALLLRRVQRRKRLATLRADVDRLRLLVHHKLQTLVVSRDGALAAPPSHLIVSAVACKV